MFENIPPRTIYTLVFYLVLYTHKNEIIHSLVLLLLHSLVEISLICQQYCSDVFLLPVVGILIIYKCSLNEWPCDDPICYGTSYFAALETAKLLFCEVSVFGYYIRLQLKKRPEVLLIFEKKFETFSKMAIVFLEMFFFHKTVANIVPFI